MGGENSIQQSWQGENIEKVFISWGIPDRKIELSEGKAMYEWFSSSTFYTPRQTTGRVNVVGNTAYVNTTTTGGESFSGSCTRSFIVNSENIIIQGSSRGNNCCFVALAGYCASLLNEK